MQTCCAQRPSTLGALFPGAMGRVWLTRVALRLRAPDLLTRDPRDPLAPAELDRVLRALDTVKEG